MSGSTKLLLAVVAAACFWLFLYYREIFYTIMFTLILLWQGMALTALIVYIPENSSLGRMSIFYWIGRLISKIKKAADDNL